MVSVTTLTDAPHPRTAEPQGRSSLPAGFCSEAPRYLALWHDRRRVPWELVVQQKFITTAKSPRNVPFEQLTSETIVLAWKCLTGKQSLRFVCALCLWGTGTFVALLCVAAHVARCIWQQKTHHCSWVALHTPLFAYCLRTVKAIVRDKLSGKVSPHGCSQKPRTQSLSCSLLFRVI